MKINIKTYFLFFSIIFIILLSILYHLDNSGNMYILYSCTLFAFIMLFVLYMICGIKYDNLCFTYWLRPSYILILSLFIVNLQTIINVLLGYADISFYLGTTEYSEYFGKVLFISLIAISSFLIGNSYSVKRLTQSSYNKKNVIHVLPWSILAIFFFILFIVNIDIVSFITGEHYVQSGGHDRDATAYARWETLYDTFLTLVIVIITNNLMIENKKSIRDYMKAIPFMLKICIVIYILLRLVSGDRGPVIYTIFLFLYSILLVTRMRLKFRYILFLVFVAAVSLNILNMVRGYGMEQSFGEKVSRGIIDLAEGNFKGGGTKSISPMTQELATSINCNFIAIHDIDKGITDYKYGLYNGCELLQGFPGSPSLIGLFGVNIYKIATYEYITISFLGENYVLGLGTTAIADFYMDFGLIGVILGFLIAGFIFKRFDQCFVNKDLISIPALIILLKFSSMSIYIPRGSFSMILSRAIYAIFFYYILYITSSFIKSLIRRDSKLVVKL